MFSIKIANIPDFIPVHLQQNDDCQKKMVIAHIFQGVYHDIYFTAIQIIENLFGKKINPFPGYARHILQLIAPAFFESGDYSNIRKKLIWFFPLPGLFELWIRQSFSWQYNFRRYDFI